MLLITGFIFLCFHLASSDVNQVAVQNVARSSNDFSKSMYQEMKSIPGNLFFSPLSLHTALAMLYLGSEGRTRVEFGQGLRLGNLEDEALKNGYQGLSEQLKSNDSSLILDIANKIFMAQDFSIKEGYSNDVARYFQSSIEKVNFGESEKARNTINGWVEEKTNHKIRDLLPPDAINNAVRTVLVNAIYFKGTWKTEFNKDSTRDGIFYGENGNKTAKLMYVHSEFRYSDSSELGAQILELPYKGTPEISMIIILPHRGTPLSEVENKLASFNLDTIQWNKVKVHVTIPKFKIEQVIDLNGVLEKMGLRSIFRVGADFSLMADEPVVVSKAIQKAFIEVNEEGSEAAAASAVIHTLSLGPSRKSPEYFEADRPFIFFLTKGRRRTLLFSGRVSTL